MHITKYPEAVHVISRRRFVSTSALACIGAFTHSNFAFAVAPSVLIPLGRVVLSSIFRFAGEAIAMWALEKVLNWAFPWNRKSKLDYLLDQISTATNFLVLLCPNCKAITRLNKLSGLRWRADARIAEALFSCLSCHAEHDYSFSPFDLLDALDAERKRSDILLTSTDEMAAYWRSRNVPKNCFCKLEQGDVVFGWCPWDFRHYDVFVHSYKAAYGPGELYRLREDELIFVYLDLVKFGFYGQKERIFMQVTSPRLPDIGYIPWVPRASSPHGGSWGEQGASYHVFCYKNGQPFLPHKVQQS